MKIDWCPHCGGHGEVGTALFKDNTKVYYVQCSNIFNCPFLPATDFYKSKRKAIQDWNDRKYRFSFSKDLRKGAD